MSGKLRPFVAANTPLKFGRHFSFANKKCMMQKLKKTTIIGLTVIIFFIGCGFLKKFQAKPNQIVHSPNSISLNFEWVGLKRGNSFDSLGAMLVPVTINGSDRKFYMQFDLGHPSTVLYKCVLDQINKQQQQQPIQYDSANKKFCVLNFDIKFEKGHITYKQIDALPCSVSQINWSDTTQKIKIGTIGSDIIENKTIVINYPLKKIDIYDQMPAFMDSAYSFATMKYKNRRVILQATIQKEERNIFYDNGSSMFELAVSESEWKKLAAKDSIENKFELSNWGKMWTVHSIATQESITFGQKTFPIQNVQYLDGPSAALQLMYKFSGIDGMTGNKLFAKNIVVIDTKNLKYAVK